MRMRTGTCKWRCCLCSEIKGSFYRASALNNPEGKTDWWQEAAKAAKDFIAKNNQQAHPYKLFTTEDNDPNKTIISALCLRLT